jgi:hypothetical protein
MKNILKTLVAIDSISGIATIFCFLLVDLKNLATRSGQQPLVCVIGLSDAQSKNYAQLQLYFQSYF